MHEPSHVVPQLLLYRLRRFIDQGAAQRQSVARQSRSTSDAGRQPNRLVLLRLTTIQDGFASALRAIADGLQEGVDTMVAIQVEAGRSSSVVVSEAIPHCSFFPWHCYLASLPSLCIASPLLQRRFEQCRWRC